MPVETENKMRHCRKAARIGHQERGHREKIKQPGRHLERLKNTGHIR
jgi:hypothetical protein